MASKKVRPIRVISETIWIDRHRGWSKCSALVTEYKGRTVAERLCTRYGVAYELGVMLCAHHGRVAVKKGVKIVNPSDIAMVTPGNRDTMTKRIEQARTGSKGASYVSY